MTNINIIARLPRPGEAIFLRSSLGEFVLYFSQSSGFVVIARRSTPAGALCALHFWARHYSQLGQPYDA